MLFTAGFFSQEGVGPGSYKKKDENIEKQIKMRTTVCILTIFNLYKSMVALNMQIKVFQHNEFSTLLTLIRSRAAIVLMLGKIPHLNMSCAELT